MIVNRWNYTMEFFQAQYLQGSLMFFSRPIKINAFLTMLQNWSKLLNDQSEHILKNSMFDHDISFQESQKTNCKKSSQTGICLFANIYQSICHYVNILRFCFDTHKQAYCNISMKILQYACLQISKVKHACLIILFCFLLL